MKPAEVTHVESLGAAISDCREDFEAVAKLLFRLLGNRRQCVKSLIETCEDTSEEGDVRVLAMRFLAALRDQKSALRLIRILEDSSEDIFIRDQASRAAADMESVAAASQFLKLFTTSRDDVVRECSARALGESISRAASKVLIAALSNVGESLAVRLAVIEALGIARTRAALPALLECLKDENVLIRGEAAWALGQLGDRRAEAALRKGLEDHELVPNYVTVSALCKEALESLSGPAPKRRKGARKSDVSR
ncbi:MAG: HEAT repeat domain-containing protein [Armatimonadetes bacterium]|nr:HEAT repeat domain-containing protein [Armatimonadota bacterium]